MADWMLPSFIFRPARRAVCSMQRETRYILIPSGLLLIFCLESVLATVEVEIKHGGVTPNVDTGP